MMCTACSDLRWIETARLIEPNPDGAVRLFLPEPNIAMNSKQKRAAFSAVRLFFYRERGELRRIAD